jgi:GNAT superfamily N-acetyltransferase
MEGRPFLLGLLTRGGLFMDNLVVRSRAFSDDLKHAAIALEDATWSSLGYLNFTRSHQRYYDLVLDEFPDLQLCLVDVESDLPVALANCVPVSSDGNFDALPAEGWDWLVETGATRRGEPANVLGALAVSVPPVHRGKGYARRMIRAVHDECERRRLDAVIVAVRPTAKCDYPHVPIEEYIGWTDIHGRVFDPWLRSHVSQGARVIGPCKRSMVVEEHIAFWETWAGRSFETSGEYLLGGALVPISIDLERQIGRYEEPNVWVAYDS